MAEISLIKEETMQVDLTNESTIDAQVTDINYIPAYKQAENERRKNEIERVSNEEERIEYYEEIRRDVENGEFDGKNTVYVGETEPTDDFYNVWINPDGTPTVEAENIVMEDGETLQDKYDNGELKGPQGEAGYTPVKGIDYLTEEDINSLKIPTKTSELENDNGFITDYEESDPTVPSHVKNITEADITHWNNGGVIGDTLPVGAEVDYNGDTVPIGWEEIENPNSYSTEETFTGKYWIDGKKIYKKVIEITEITLGSQSTYTHNLSMDSVIVSDLFAYRTQGNTFIKFPYNGNADGSYNANYFLGLNDVQTNIFKYYVGSGWTTLTKLRMILKYTKTTE